MKNKLIISLLLLLAITRLAAQLPVLKVYAYSRESIPGNIPRFDNDSMRKAHPLIIPRTYYVYAEVKKGNTLSAECIYAAGKYYKVTMTKVESPVRIDKVNGIVEKDNKETLVNKTSNDVYAFRLLEEITDWPAKAAAEKQRKGKPVLLCLVKGKKKIYAGAKEIVELEPVHGL
jgi:hypothetical protein